jgi:cation transport regulator ChaB
MFYKAIDDLPVHCLINLPKAALQVYKDAFNRAWSSAASSASRHRDAQIHAWTEVRKRFEKDTLSGRWVPRVTTARVHVVKNAVSRARKRTR